MTRRSQDRSVRMYQMRVHLGNGRGGHFLLPMLGLLVFSCLTTLMFVWFNSQDECMGRGIRETRQRIVLRAKELENLRIEVESYKRGRYIQRAVAEMGLQLREPEKGQVHRVDQELRERNPEWLQEDMVARK